MSDTPARVVLHLLSGVMATLMRVWLRLQILYDHPGGTVRGVALPELPQEKNVYDHLWRSPVSLLDLVKGMSMLELVWKDLVRGPLNVV